MNFIKKSMIMVFSLLFAFVAFFLLSRYRLLNAGDLVFGICYCLTAACGVIFASKVSDDKKVRIAIIISMLMAAVIRIIYVHITETAPVSDYKTMYESAVAFANGNNPFLQKSYFHRFPHMTFYPLVCGIIFRFSGANILLIKYLHILLSVMCIPVIYKLCTLLCNRKAGIAAAWLYTFFPPSIAYCAVFATENFALPFLITSLYFLVCAYKSSATKERLIKILISGALLTVGCLFRGVWIYYIVSYIAIILIIFSHDKIKSILALVCTFVLLFAAVSNILYLSNATKYKITSGDVPYSTYILVGFNFETKGMFSAEDQNLYFEAGQNKDEMQKLVSAKLMKRIKENPHRILPLLADKTCTVFASSDFDGIYWSYANNGRDGDKPMMSAFYCASLLYYSSLIIMIFIAVFRNKGNRTIIVPTVILLVFECGLMLMEVQPRYTYSCAYAFILLASYIFNNHGNKKEVVL
ncbi:MAG: glycosyltransferase family 39 protein [Clostridia bacterium]|nr:glycosyltransferase family 39 protein [Clostridia bacterium]